MTHIHQLVKFSKSCSAAAAHLLILFTILLLFQHNVNAICPECLGKIRQTQECAGQIGDCLVLRCNIAAGGWYLTSPTNNVTIGTSDKDKRLDNYEIVGGLGDNSDAIWLLNITKNTNQNFGVNRILNQQSSNFGGSWCHFSVFVYGII